MAKKRRSAKQKANDKRLGRMAKARAAGRKIKRKVKSSTKKGQVRKTARRAFTKVKKVNKRRKKSKSVKSIKSLVGSSTIKKVALGVGGATMAAALISYIAPNSSIARFAAPAGAYALGGIEGIIGNFALGMLTPRTSTNANVAPQMEAL